MSKVGINPRTAVPEEVEELEAPPTVSEKKASIDKLKSGISHDLMTKAMDMAETKAPTTIKNGKPIPGKVTSESKAGATGAGPADDAAPFELICNVSFRNL